MVVLVLALRRHRYNYNPNFLRENFTCLGVGRLMIAFLCWCPAVFYWIPHFDDKVMTILATPVKIILAGMCLFMFVPWFFERLG